MQPTARDAIRRVLTLAGVSGAALTLSAAAALPALACHGGHADDGDSSAPAGQQHRHADSASSTGDRHAKPARSQGRDGEGNKEGKNGGDASKDSRGSADSRGSTDSKPRSSHSRSDRPASTDAKPASDGHNPPGNNGTVFIHRSAGDSHPGNQPHVTCSFFVALFGFDNGQALTASFTGQAPTGKGIALPVTDGTATTTTSPDAAGGAGNDYDGDLGPFTVSNLDVASKLGAPAKQGWHITLTVATGQGEGKHKVFWLAPCAPAGVAPGGVTAGDTGGTTQPGTTVAGSDTGAGAVTPGSVDDDVTTGSAAGGAQVLGEKLSRGTASGTQVLGESLTRPASTGSLPFTGAEIGLMSGAAAAAVGTGAVLLLAGRRRRRSTPQH